MKPTKSMTERLAQRTINAIREENLKEVKAAIAKKAGANLDWTKIHKAKNSFGEDYVVEKVNNNETRLHNSEEDFTGPDGIVIPAFDFYDDDGNLVSKSE